MRAEEQDRSASARAVATKSNPGTKPLKNDLTRRDAQQGETHRVLGDDAAGLADAGDGAVSGAAAVNEDLALVHVVEAEQEAHDRALAAWQVPKRTTAGEGQRLKLT